MAFVVMTENLKALIQKKNTHLMLIVVQQYLVSNNYPVGTKKLTSIV